MTKPSLKYRQETQLSVCPRRTSVTFPKVRPFLLDEQIFCPIPVNTRIVIVHLELAAPQLLEARQYHGSRISLKQAVQAFELEEGDLKEARREER